MFDVLSQVSTAAAAGGIYRALTELFEASATRSLRQIRTELKNSKIGLPNHSESAALALRILEEIRTAKRKELSALTDKEVREIARMLSQILERKASTEPHYDRSTGTAILDDLRKEFGALNAGT